MELAFQINLVLEPTIIFSPPFGETTCNAPTLKVLSLSSLIALLARSEILILTESEKNESGILQAKVPAEAGVALVILTQFAPLLDDTSILTLEIFVLLFQVILYVCPLCKNSPPFGELTVNTLIVKRELLVSLICKP